MKSDTPVTLATAKYNDRESAVADFKAVWEARHKGEFDHTALAVLTKDDSGKLRVDRHDSTTKHLTWGGALLGGALAVVAPPVGVAVLAASGTAAGAGAIVGHFHHNIPKKDVEAAAAMLEAGQSGLIVVAVNRKGSDIEGLLGNAVEKTSLETTWGDLDDEIEKELAAAKG